MEDSLIAPTAATVAAESDTVPPPARHRDAEDGAPRSKKRINHAQHGCMGISWGRLAVELMQTILPLSLPYTSRDEVGQTPWHLGHIDKYTRETAKTCRPLWTHIHIDCDREIDAESHLLMLDTFGSAPELCEALLRTIRVDALRSIQERAAEQLNRALNHPLSIHFRATEDRDPDEWTKCGQLLEMVAELAPQWRLATLRMDPRLLKHMQRIRGRLVGLQSLNIEIARPFGNWPTEDESRLVKELFSAARCLRHLELPSPLARGLLPTLPVSNLTSIRATYCRALREDVLPWAVNVENLFIEPMFGLGIGDTSTERLEMKRVRHLRTPHVECLSTMELPALEALTIGPAFQNDNGQLEDFLLASGEPRVKTLFVLGNGVGLASIMDALPALSTLGLIVGNERESWQGLATIADVDDRMRASELSNLIVLIDEKVRPNDFRGGLALYKAVRTWLNLRIQGRHSTRSLRVSGHQLWDDVRDELLDMVQRDGLQLDFLDFRKDLASLIIRNAEDWAWESQGPWKHRCLNHDPWNAWERQMVDNKYSYDDACSLPPQFGGLRSVAPFEDRRMVFTAFRSHLPSGDRGRGQLAYAQLRLEGTGREQIVLERHVPPGARNLNYRVSAREIEAHHFGAVVQLVRNSGEVLLFTVEKGQFLASDWNKLARSDPNAEESDEAPDDGALSGSGDDFDM
ncbi:hypothetical protein C8R43DRAFT_942804 [Mycena crocata]|nr:hypothetical protein C8R43DRAFT_942804 [Mycena crocata]